jgi:hypothetical protein
MPIRGAPETALIVYTALMAAITIGFLVWWLRAPAERRVGPALPFLLIGGAVSGLMEAWLDNVVLVGYPPEQNLPVVHAFGRSVPIFVPIGYAWFCGGLLYVVARYWQRHGVTAAKVWALYGAIVVVDFVAIGLSSWLGILDFFGDPPLDVAGYPLWWAAFDGLDVIVGAAILLLALDHLRGPRQTWLVLLPPIALGASSGIVGWPVSTAINSGWSDPAKYACAVATIGLSVVCVRFIGVVLPRLWPVTRQMAAGDSSQAQATVRSTPSEPSRRPVGTAVTTG